MAKVGKDVLLASVLLALFCSPGFGQVAPEPWAKSEMLEPATLAKMIEDGKTPVIVSVAFPVLYRNRHIVHALDAGAGSKPEGIAALERLVANAPKESEVVIYCGCCPLTKCPNIRPAFRALQNMGFQKIRVLNIPTNMHDDWYTKGYPSEPGSASGQPAP